MRSKIEKPCSLCDSTIKVGDVQGKWLGGMAHFGCREGAKASIVRKQLPDNRAALERGLWADARKQVMRPGVGKTRGIHPLA